MSVMVSSANLESGRIAAWERRLHRLDLSGEHELERVRGVSEPEAQGIVDAEAIVVQPLEVFVENGEVHAIGTLHASGRWRRKDRMRESPGITEPLISTLKSGNYWGFLAIMPGTLP